MATKPKTPEQLRAAKIKRLQTDTARVHKINAQLAEAIAKRNATLIDVHGDRATGGLSYRDMAEATGMSSGWVIEIVQGKSEYSKEQERLRAVRATEDLDEATGEPEVEVDETPDTDLTDTFGADDDGEA